MNCYHQTVLNSIDYSVELSHRTHHITYTSQDTGTLLGENYQLTCTYYNDTQLISIRNDMANHVVVLFRKIPELPNETSPE